MATARAVVRVKTMERLTAAFEEARILEFDGDSRIVILSDCHRGDGSTSDEFAKNRSIFIAALEHYYREGFTYIEAGDGDELWEYPAFKYVMRANPVSLNVVKKFHDAGRYIRLWGNHDMQMKYPEYVRTHFHTRFNEDTERNEEFLPGLNPCEAVVLLHRHTRQEIFVVHGMQGDFANDQAWWFTMWSLRLFWRYFHAAGIRSPSSPVRNSFKRHKVERNYNKWIKKHRTALICGHTHRERFPRGGDLPYFNSGACTFPAYITGIEIVDDTIALVRWRVDPDEQGYLRVMRYVMVGPAPIEQFHMKGHAANA